MHCNNAQRVNRKHNCGAAVIVTHSFYVLYKTRLMMMRSLFVCWCDAFFLLARVKQNNMKNSLEK